MLDFLFIVDLESFSSILRLISTYIISFGCLEFNGTWEGYFLWRLNACHTQKNRKMTLTAVFWFQFCSVSLLLHNFVIKVISFIKYFNCQNKVIFAFLHGFYLDWWLRIEYIKGLQITPNTEMWILLLLSTVSWMYFLTPSGILRPIFLPKHMIKVSPLGMQFIFINSDLYHFLIFSVTKNTDIFIKRNLPFVRISLIKIILSLRLWKVTRSLFPREF